MSNKLIIVMSGKKQSGKNSTANYIIWKYLNDIKKCNNYKIDNSGDLVDKSDYSVVNNNTLIKYGCKIYSFADYLKTFLIDVLNVPYNSCYGTEKEKNKKVDHIIWENFPQEVRNKVNDDRIKRESKNKFHYLFNKYIVEYFSLYDNYPSGPMTGREIMQVFGTEMIRNIYFDCWARSTYNQIKKDGYELSIISDGRFENEILIGEEFNAKSIRLLRCISNDTHPSEIGLDDFPKEKFSLVIDNRDMTFKEQCDYVSPFIDNWFKEVEF